MELKCGNYRLGRAHDISIPVAFVDGVAEFGAHPASKTPFKAKQFIGDVKAGGSCNCDMITFSPHLHGTHTECIGHIVAEEVHVHTVLKEPLMQACLISITPQAAKDSKENYVPNLRPDDKLITKAALEILLGKEARSADRANLELASCDLQQQIAEALIVRTGWKPGSEPPPFFSIEAMEYICELKVQHLLVDMPSIDRMDDDGKLTAHHIFWGLEQGHHTLAGGKPSQKTVTEFIHVPASVPDGNYVLNLQVAAFAADAAPSRPLIYELIK